LNDPKQRAYVLVRIQPGNESEFYGEMKRLPHIVQVDLVHGPYDFVVQLEGSPADMDSVVLKIRKIPYVLNTDTMTAFVLS
jgi:hypothetical protein